MFIKMSIFFEIRPSEYYFAINSHQNVFKCEQIKFIKYEQWK